MPVTQKDGGRTCAARRLPSDRRVCRSAVSSEAPPSLSPFLSASISFSFNAEHFPMPMPITALQIDVVIRRLRRGAAPLAPAALTKPTSNGDQERGETAHSDGTTSHGPICHSFGGERLWGRERLENSAAACDRRQTSDGPTQRKAAVPSLRRSVTVPLASADRHRALTHRRAHSTGPRCQRNRLRLRLRQTTCSSQPTNRTMRCEIERANGYGKLGLNCSKCIEPQVGDLIRVGDRFRRDRTRCERTSKETDTCSFNSCHFNGRRARSQAITNNSVAIERTNVVVMCQRQR